MSIKKLFDDKNRKNSGKLLKANSLNTLAREVEDPQQIVEAEKKRLEFVPPVDYSRPENFAKFGSASPNNIHSTWLKQVWVIGYIKQAVSK